MSKCVNSQELLTGRDYIITVKCKDKYRSRYVTDGTYQMRWNGHQFYRKNGDELDAVSLVDVDSITK